MQTQAQKSCSLVNCKENKTAVQAAALLFTSYQSHSSGTQLDHNTVVEKLHVFGINEFGK